jgi:hypothetical protein
MLLANVALSIFHLSFHSSNIVQEYNKLILATNLPTIAQNIFGLYPWPIGASEISKSIIDWKIPTIIAD